MKNSMFSLPQKISNIFFTSTSLLRAVYEIMADRDVNGRWIFPNTFLNNPSEINNIIEIIKPRDIPLFINVMKLTFFSSNIKCRILPPEKIPVTLSSEDNKIACIILRDPLAKITVKKLIIHNGNVAKMIKDYFLSLWEIAEEVDKNSIDILKKTIEKLKKK